MTAQIKPDTRIIIRDSHRKAVEKCLDGVSGPFRRSDLAKVLYPLTAPRNRNNADKLADMLISELAKKGLSNATGISIGSRYRPFARF